jgi:hypothetical protein
MLVVAFVLEAFRSTVSRTPGQTRSSAPGWLRAVMPVVGEHYGKAEALALTSYRLERALRTGRATGVPWRNTRAEPLVLLRREFVQAVTDISPRLHIDMGYPEIVDGGELVEVDPIDGLEEILGRLSDATERMTREALNTVGPEAYAFRGARDGADLDELFENAAAAAAGEAARSARRGGRATREAVRNRDAMVVGYVRVCAKPDHDTHPCGFCAMLMSRGMVYRSEASARGSKPDGYHANCDCEPVELWSKADYQDERFDRNREYRRLWDDHIKGTYAGDEAIREWRKLIDGLNARKAPTPDAPSETQETALEATE